jgi:hypothetical protein
MSQSSAVSVIGAGHCTASGFQLPASSFQRRPEAGSWKLEAGSYFSQSDSIPMLMA